MPKWKSCKLILGLIFVECTAIVISNCPELRKVLVYAVRNSILIFLTLYLTNHIKRKQKEEPNKGKLEK